MYVLYYNSLQPCRRLAKYGANVTLTDWLGVPTMGAVRVQGLGRCGIQVWGFGICGFGVSLRGHEMCHTRVEI